MPPSRPLAPPRPAQPPAAIRAHERPWTTITGHNAPCPRTALLGCFGRLLTSFSCMERARAAVSQQAPQSRAARGRTGMPDSTATPFANTTTCRPSSSTAAPALSASVSAAEAALERSLAPGCLSSTSALRSFPKTKERSKPARRRSCCSRCERI